MSNTITAQDANEALSKAFMTIQYKGVTYWNNKSLSRKLGEEAVKLHDLSTGDVDSRVATFPKACREPLTECNTAWGHLRALFRETPIIPFGDSSDGYTGLISNSHYVGTFVAEYAKRLSSAERARDHLIDQLATMISAAQSMRTNTDITVDYPTEEYLLTKFRAEPLNSMVGTIPMATSTENLVFPADAAQNLVDDLVDRGVEASPVVRDMRTTMDGIKQRLVESMTTLNERVHTYEANRDTETVTRFTGALTKNVTDVLVSMRESNLFESEDVTKLANSLEKRMHMFKPERIKATPQGAHQAKEVTKAIADIADQIVWY